MKTPRLLLAISASLLPAFATYTYDDPSLLNPYTSTKWTSNGTNTVATNSYTSTAANGGSLIFNQALPAPANNYEVRFTMALTANGGNYLAYMRATSNAQLATTSTGTFYAVEISNPVLSGGAYTASLKFIKCVSGTVTIPNTTTIYPHNGAVIRVVFNQGNGLVVYMDNVFQSSYYDGSPIASGQPGVGMMAAPAGNAITAVDIGHLDTIAPTAINPQLIGTSVFPNHVDIQFPGAIDDTNGTGVVYYQYFRNGSWLTLSTEPELNDTTVAPSTTYSYILQAVDFHGNLAQTTFNVTTPATGAIDPRRTGVRTTGTYWGAGGEQIDLRSGNLNYTIPLIKVTARCVSAGFSLNYNSQNWRQDPGGTWQLGRDVGYGYGWKLQTASLTPVYRDYWTLDHYLFIDSTGAEYRLTVNTGGIWSSQESIYVYYDPALRTLHFTDGSSWVFGCMSAGTEQDAGTMYPSNIYDSNGNYIAISYNAGAGVPYTYSSSRISNIEDVRGKGSADYTFTYNADTPIPHLSGITNNIGTAEKYTFSYTSGTLTSPFTPATGYGSWTFLSGVSNNIPLTTLFNYDSSGSGELIKVTFPYGGYIKWAYGPFTYAGSRILREVSGGRKLAMSALATELPYNIVFAPDVTPTFHPWGAVYDPDGLGQKSYYFGTDSAQPSFGILTLQQSFPHYAPNVNGGRFDAFTWTADSAGNPYISKDVTTEDYNNPGQIQKQTTQTRDQYGNVTQMQMFDYGNFTTPVRTYTNTYQNAAAYTSLYIFNRLLTSTVTDGTHTTTLASNTYDQGILGTAAGIFEHSSQYDTTWTTRGNPTTIVSPSGTTTVTYDIAGNVTLTNVNGLPTSHTLNTTTNFAAPSAITTNSFSSTMNYTAALGLSSAAGPNGDTLGIAYDTNNRPHTTTAPTGAITTFTYNDTTSPPTKVATTNSHWVRTTMDGLGRTTRTETGNGTTTVSTVDTQYVPCGCSPLGKVGQTSQPYAPGGTVYWTVYHYDGLGRTTSVVAPDNSTTTYTYASNTVTVTDPASKSKTFTMDALGHLSRVQESDPTLLTVNTNYTYDMLDHLIGVSMPRGANTQTRTFNYLTGTVVGMDLLSSTNPENGTVSYTYNSDHTVHTKTDNKGQLFTYSYDGYRRLTQIMLGASTVLRTFMYDSNTIDTTFSGSYTQGRLVAVQHPAFTPQGFQSGIGGSNVSIPSSMQFIEMYAYSQAGQALKKRLRVNETMHYYTNTNILHDDPESIDMDGTYTYDNEGKMTSVNYPQTISFTGTTKVTNNGPTYTYSFDAMRRPTGLTDQNSNTLVNNVTYNAANQLLTFNSETRTYNNLNQMTRLQVTGNLDISYNFPAGTNNGKISTQTDNISGETVTYAYDSLNRLVSATSSQSWSETYGFDGFGNLLSKTPTGGAPTLSQAVDTATNYITGQTYDGNGNQTSSPLGTLTYDAENRIASMSAGGVQYKYDSRNKRIWKSILSAGNLSQEVYFYGVDGQKIATYTIQLVLFNGNIPQMSDNTGIKLSTFFGSKRLGTYDRLGSAKFNPNGQQQSFYPYGEDRGTMQPNDSLKFATYTRDTATGLDYADQRYYANNFGRFMSPDPYNASASGGKPQSWNRYMYVLGDPVNFQDKSGLLRAKTAGDDGDDDNDCPDGDCGDPEGGSGGGDCSVNDDGTLTCGQIGSAEGTARPDPDPPVPDPEPPPDPTPAPQPPAAPPGPPVPSKPKKPKKCTDPKNAAKIAWINAHLADATKVAGELGVTAADILGLSAIESGWGTGPFVVNGRNNFFSQHAPAPDSDGKVPIGRAPGFMATYANYGASAQSFADQYGYLVENLADPTKFGAALQNAGKYGINSDGSKVANFVSATASTINGLGSLIECVQ